MILGNKNCKFTLIKPKHGTMWSYHFPVMTPSLNQLLLDRLQQQVVNANDAPALLRDKFKTLESNPGINLATTNSKLQLLGWNGVTLDYQSLQLALTLKPYSLMPILVQAKEGLWLSRYS